MSDLLRDLGYDAAHDVASAFGVEVATLRNWRSRGLGPAYSRAGGQVVYPRDALRDWLASNMVTPAPTPTLADTPKRGPGRPQKNVEAHA